MQQILAGKAEFAVLAGNTYTSTLKRNGLNAVRLHCVSPCLCDVGWRARAEPGLAAGSLV